MSKEPEWTPEQKELIEKTFEETDTTVVEDDPAEFKPPMIGHDWTPEEREKVKALFKTLERKPEPPKIDLRKFFKAGGQLKLNAFDTAVIRTVGREAITVELKDKKKRLVEGAQFQVGGYGLRVVRLIKRQAVLECVGFANPR